MQFLQYNKKDRDTIQNQLDIKENVQLEWMRNRKNKAANNYSYFFIFFFI